MVVVMPMTMVMLVVRMVVIVVVLMRGVVTMLIVLVVMTITQKIGVNFQGGVEVKTSQIKHLVNRHFTKVHDVLRRSGVHML